MKKALVILAFVCLYSLNCRAQTKEETINWISDKIKQYGGLQWCFDFNLGGEYFYSKITISDNGKDIIIKNKTVKEGRVKDHLWEDHIPFSEIIQSEIKGSEDMKYIELTTPLQ